MAARAATRDAGRVFDIPYGRVDKIAKLIPEGQIEGKPVTINNALKAVAELRAAYESDETTKQILDTARTLEGLARQDSIHAAGVVISDEELTEYTPIQRKSGPETVTQYHMDAIKKIGLLKMDFLGLRTLTVIDNAVKMIKQTKGIEIDIDNIPYDDDKTYEMLQQGESIGVFQLESTGMRNLLKDLQPSNFEDIVALLALYRPGPLGSGMVKDFCDRKHGRKPITYLHPSLEPILRETYGIIVYQEQVMQIASEMAGFSMAEADILRAAMSKKKADVLAEQREKFIRGAKRRGIDAKTAGKVFDLVDHFAGYGFNRSHSTAYAVISYQTAYLKANYPVEFMAALLTSVMGNKDKVAQYVNECRRLSIKVLPPDVNESYRDFTVIGGAIRFGLSAVRNVGEAAIESIIRERETGGRFKSIFDFSRRVDHTVINKRAMESLIKSGAFDSCGPSRKYMLEVFEKAIEAGVKHQKDKAIGQFTIFDLDQEETMEKMPEEAAEFEKSELLAYEKEMLGLYVTDHPLLGMESVLKNNTQFSLGELLEQRDGTVVWIGGIIVRQTRITTKKGEPMLFFTLEDLEGSIEVVAFPSIYERYKDFLSEDRVVRVKGRVDKKEDEIKFIAQEIEPLDTEESPRQLTLKIVLSTNNFNRRVIEELKTLLRNHAGPIPVCLQVMDSEKVTTLSLARSYGVTIDDGLFAELKVLLGEEAVSLQKV
jgi:DNA polymerase-3 subunit alpha